ncbi:hypothetical protein [Streptomyces chryseus]
MGDPLQPPRRPPDLVKTLALHGNHGDAEQYEAGLADALDQLMRRVHSGHATKTEQALLARTAQVPLPTARQPGHDTARPTDSPAQQEAEGENDSIDDLDDLPDDDFSPVPVAGFGLYDAHEEADKW